MKFKGFFSFLILASFLYFSPSFCEEKNKGKEFIHSEIRDYLLNNPEVILESLKRYERKITNLDSDSEQSLVDSQFVELTQDRFSYVGGNKNGSINIVAFFDYKCGYCKRANAELSELILENKDVRFILKEFPILGQESLIAAQASIVVLMDQGDNVYKAFTDKILTHSGNISIKKPLSRAKSVCIKKVNKPQINAYKVTAKNKCPEDFMSIWRITDLYKPNIEKIGIPIIGAINISLIVSSFGKYQRSKRIEYDAHKIKTNNILSVKTIINFLDNLERFDILVNIFYFHLIFL